MGNALEKKIGTLINDELLTNAQFGDFLRTCFLARSSEDQATILRRCAAADIFLFTKDEITALGGLIATRLVTNGAVNQNAKSTGHLVQMGKPVTDKGILLKATLRTPKGAEVSLKLIPDFLRKGGGEIAELNFREAVAWANIANDGRTYGEGTAKAIGQAIDGGTFLNGDIIIAPAAALFELHDRLKESGFGTIKGIVDGSSSHASWCVSSTGHSSDPSYVGHVRLKDRNDSWYSKDGLQSRVVACRCG